jgi:hypothetical protein
MFRVAAARRKAPRDQEGGRAGLGTLAQERMDSARPRLNHNGFGEVTRWRAALILMRDSLVFAMSDALPLQLGKPRYVAGKTRRYANPVHSRSRPLPSADG